MKKLKCVAVDDDEICLSLIGRFIQKQEELELTHTFNNAIEAYTLLQKEQIDILFLDVEMPEMTGLDLIRALPDSHLQIILTTSREKYAVEAFELEVADYIVKPVLYPRFLKTIERAKKRIKEYEETAKVTSPDNQFFFVRSNYRIVKLAPVDIIYIEALADYVIIYTTSQRHIVHFTMKGLEEKLGQFKTFVRVHRSYIINLDHFKMVHDDEITVSDKKVPLGRSYKSSFLERIETI
jgi:DNA-binding LytR/AlgR family response regulator